MYLNGTKCHLLLILCLTCLLSGAFAGPQTGGSLVKPLCFVENKGQIMAAGQQRSDIQFQLYGQGVTMYVGNGKLIYKFSRKEGDKVQNHAFTMELVGCNAATVTTGNPNAYFENYYLTYANSEMITANAWNTVTYKNIYPGIDWVLYVKDGMVEYDFNVAPGADASQIKMRYKGADIRVNAGELTATTTLGTITEHAPIAWESISHKEVKAAFAQDGNIVTFAVAPHKGALTIDPSLQWATYFGGNSDDIIYGVKAAGNGDIYVCGATQSSDLPVTAGAFQSALAGSQDAFVGKYNAGGALAWATYFGGTAVDQANAIDVSQGDSLAFVVGYTRSMGLASSAAVHRPTFSGGFGSDMFLAKFTSAGQRRYSTYIGRTRNDEGKSVAVDPSGFVYVGGLTSSDSISNDGTVLLGTQDGYLAKFNQANPGNRLWATYVGGARFDEIDAITCNASGVVAATGQTTSDTGIATRGAAQTILGSTGSGTDAFVVVYSSVGNRTWGSYIGGSGNDQGLGIDMDQSSNIFVTGTTSSSDSIAYGYSETSAWSGSSGLPDGFVCKFTSTGAQNWGTYIAGNSVDNPGAVAVDKDGNIVVSGYTSSTSGIATTGAFLTSNAGNTDAFVIKYSTWGQKFYGTYYGGSFNDYGYGITTAANDASVIMAGASRSNSGIATVGAQQTSYAGGSAFGDGMLVKFAPDTLVAIAEPYYDTLVCAGGTLTIADTTFGTFQSGNTFTIQLSDASGSFASPVTIGTASATRTGTISCTIPTGTTPGTGYRIRIVSSSPAYTSPVNRLNIHIVNSLPSSFISGTPLVCVGQTILMIDSVTYPVNSYSWSGPSSYTAATRRVTISPAAAANSGVYSVTTTHNGCPDVTNTFSVTVNTYIPPAPVDSVNAPICEGTTLMLFARSIVSGTFTYNWSGPAGFSSTAQNPVIAAASSFRTGTYFVTNTLNACTSPASSIFVRILPLDTPNVTVSVAPNDTVCAGTELRFTATTTRAGISPTYQWMSGAGSPIVGAVFANYSMPGVYAAGSIFCIMRPDVACSDKPYDTSNTINYTLLDNTPAVTITVSPDSFIAAGGSVTFTGLIGGYSTSGFQWYVNNVPVFDTTLTLRLTGIRRNDTVRLEATSSAICARPGVSNTIIIRVPTGVEMASAGEGTVELSPNPNTGMFIVTGNIPGLGNDVFQASVMNALGQEVYSTQVTGQQNNFRFTADLQDLAPGVYVLTLNTGGAYKAIRFIKN